MPSFRRHNGYPCDRRGDIYDMHGDFDDLGLAEIAILRSGVNRL